MYFCIVAFRTSSSITAQPKDTTGFLPFSVCGKLVVKNYLDWNASMSFSLNENAISLSFASSLSWHILDVASTQPNVQLLSKCVTVFVTRSCSFLFGCAFHPCSPTLLSHHHSLPLIPDGQRESDETMLPGWNFDISGINANGIFTTDSAGEIAINSARGSYAIVESRPVSVYVGWRESEEGRGGERKKAAFHFLFFLFRADSLQQLPPPWQLQPTCRRQTQQSQQAVQLYVFISLFHPGRFVLALSFLHFSLLYSLSLSFPYFFAFHWFRLNLAMCPCLKWRFLSSLWPHQHTPKQRSRAFYRARKAHLWAPWSPPTTTKRPTWTPACHSYVPSILCLQAHSPLPLRLRNNNWKLQLVTPIILPLQRLEYATNPRSPNLHSHLSLFLLLSLFECLFPFLTDHTPFVQVRLGESVLLAFLLVVALKVLKYLWACEQQHVFDFCFPLRKLICQVL